MNKDFQPLRVMVTQDLAHRLERIAKKRFGTTHRKLPMLGVEAIMEFTERQEKALKLEPITVPEIKEALAA